MPDHKNTLNENNATNSGEHSILNKMLMTLLRGMSGFDLNGHRYFGSAFLYQGPLSAPASPPAPDLSLEEKSTEPTFSWNDYVVSFLYASLVTGRWPMGHDLYHFETELPAEQLNAADKNADDAPNASPSP